MKSFLLSALVFTAAHLFAQVDPPRNPVDNLTRALMPMPANIQFQHGAFRIATKMTVAVKDAGDDRVRKGVDRTLRRLEVRTGLVLAREYGADPRQARLVVIAEQPGRDVPAVGEDESYRLTANDKQILLHARTAIGALRGLETLLQLLQGDGQGFFIPTVVINDSPRFVWRGLMIDSGRHFQPMEVLKRNLDGMASLKLNVLHWHLSEDQGFRIESKKFPKLHEMGSDGQFYTQDQAREIIAYARERGIRVIPEFDMPGHTQSWLVGYPELGAAPGPHQISRQWGIMDAAFDPTREETYKFLDRFLGEMAGLFPDAYMHVGGDESNGKWWDANPKITDFKQRKGIKDDHALQAYFSQRLQKILTKHHKRMMGWDEILQPDLPKDVVVHSWRGTKALADAAKQGYDGVLSAPYYIDLMRPASVHYAADIIPPGSDLTDEQRKHALGGEATMWSEYVGPENIDSRIWPRTAAIAERFWSPACVNDVDDMYRRLAAVSIQLEELGLTHIRNRDAMLRRMAGSEDIAALRQLVALVAPVQGYRRQKVQPSDAFTPLTKLVDASDPDSGEVRAFAKAVEKFLADAPKFQSGKPELLAAFARWQLLPGNISSMAQSRPLLGDAAARAQDIGALAAACVEAVDYLSSGRVPPPSWLQSRSSMLEEAGKAKGAVEIAILPATRELIYAAAELATLDPGRVQEWRQRVKALANPPRAEDED